MPHRKKKHLSSSQTDLSSNSIGVNANRGEAIPKTDIWSHNYSVFESFEDNAA